MPRCAVLVPDLQREDCRYRNRPAQSAWHAVKDAAPLFLQARSTCDRIVNRRRKKPGLRRVAPGPAPDAAAFDGTTVSAAQVRATMRAARASFPGECPAGVPVIKY